MSRLRVSICVGVVLIFHATTYGFSGDKHANLAFQIIGVRNSTCQNRIAVAISSINNGIDNAKELQGDAFKNRLRLEIPEIAEKLPQDFSSLLHRWFFHWGYNVVDPGTSAGAKPFRDKFQKKLDSMLLEGILTGDEVVTLRESIYRIVKSEWIERNRSMHSQVMNVFGLPHEQATGLATILYEIHILGDYVSPDEGAQNQVEALGPLAFHVEEELLTTGMAKLFQKTRAASSSTELRQRILAVLQDPIVKGVDKELQSSPTDFTELFSSCGSISSKSIDSRRAMRILLILRSTLPKMLSDVYGDRPFKEKGVEIESGTSFMKGVASLFW